ncbi:uncharacterized protein BO72DRAFT_38555 [Aspergillus fijiensis CBS 313.89]|uniref:Uncharacterized protein n=1 Tax=Aspergillus fijiensis CBS 313.89 TaxID=1448319 RepID=A0A8G1VSE8_9EURO|nr:uncharacterized protein BO72DRAFT_38555 [Aspergillus fijiensis CBS 313.89]RAK70952.1 hypothetical protein BO72DRAFT_38555 [Aspergillus fijiensis CBS 313.89]
MHSSEGADTALYQPFRADGNPLARLPFHNPANLGIVTLRNRATWHELPCCSRDFLLEAYGPSGGKQKRSASQPCPIAPTCLPVLVVELCQPCKRGGPKHTVNHSRQLVGLVPPATAREIVQNHDSKSHFCYPFFCLPFVIHPRCPLSFILSFSILYFYAGLGESAALPEAETSA